MQKSDHFALDGIGLQTILAVYDMGSLHGASDRLGVPQSTLSHRLERARLLIGDPLFVRAGRSIVPTTACERMIEHARTAVRALDALAGQRSAAPHELTDTFVIGATDYERKTFLNNAARTLLAAAPGITVRLAWDHGDGVEALRQGRLDVLVMPAAGPAPGDIHHQPLYQDTILAFYDPAHRAAPDTLEAYLAGRHVRVRFSDGDDSIVDTALAQLGLRRTIALDVPASPRCRTWSKARTAS